MVDGCHHLVVKPLVVFIAAAWLATTLFEPFHMSLDDRPLSCTVCETLLGAKGIATI